MLTRWCKKQYIALLLSLIVILPLVSVTFAEETSLPVGDVNGDSAVSAADAAIVLRVAAGNYPSDTQFTDAADVTGNLAVTQTDALTLLMCAAGFADSAEAITSSLGGALLGEKYLEKFTYRGPIQTENSYRSDSVSVTRTCVRYMDTNCYVADIYIRDIKALRTAFSSNKLNGKTQTVLKMAQNHDAIIAINGDYYTRNNKYGLLVRNGVLHRSGSNKQYDTCVIYTDGHMATFPPNTKVSEIEAEGEIWQSWTFGPSLMEDGMAKTTFTCNNSICGLNPRAAIGYYEPGHYCFVLADGRAGKTNRGLTMESLSAFMADELGCTLAYNLDGGQTAVMATKDEVVNDPANGGRTSPDILYICDPASSVDE